MSDFLHLQESVRPLMALSDTLRAHHLLRPRFIEHDHLTPVMRCLSFEIARPAEREARGHAIYGPPGAGKTMLAAAIARRFRVEGPDAGGMRNMNVAIIEMTGAREMKTIYERILDALGVPDYQQYRGKAREDMVIRTCRAAGLRMLILDEFQDILTSTARQHLIAIETVKFLFNVLNLSIVALGTKKVPLAMKRDEHLVERFKFTELTPWRDGQRLRRFLKAYERSLPLALPSNLGAPDMSAALATRSEGKMRALTELLSLAAVHAVETGTEKIDLKMLELAEMGPPMKLLKGGAA